MDLTELRRRLAGADRSAPPVANLSADTRAMLARLEAIRHRPASPRLVPPLADRLGGQAICPGVIEVVRRYPLSMRHGRLSLAAVARVEADRHGCLRWQGPLPLERLVFLDTETTGLAGGAGTIAFLVGVGRLGRDVLELRQWLLTAFAGEAAMLEQLAATLAADAVLVSFNGKSFDVPLLDTRAQLHGRASRLRGRPHIDLLHALRRAHGRQLPDCRLQTAEVHLLGLKRTDDLPGEQAPAAWRAWLACGESERLNEVLAHNRNDLLSTAMLLAMLASEERVGSGLEGVGTSP